ncbi:MAG: RuvX/YqgF family protein [Acidobacteria bacterium]|nr:RuvX/YqgF family protein [Acidobacteriota bacterium]
MEPPRRTLARKGDDASITAILAFCAEEEAEGILFGIPRSPEGIESPFAARIRSFARKLARRTALPIHFHEETLTSNEAARRLAPGFSREAADRTAAAVLLEDWLSHVANGRRP